MERALAHLKHTLWAYNIAMEPWVENDDKVEGEERIWEHRYAHLRRSLLKMANDIVDEYGPSDEVEQLAETYPNRRLRVEHLWEVYSTMLEMWGIVKTEDGKMFTFAETGTKAEEKSAS